jgi:thymidylate kinase
MRALDHSEISEHDRSSLARLAAAPGIAGCPLARLAPAYGLDPALAVALVRGTDWERLRLAAGPAPGRTGSFPGRFQRAAEWARGAWRRPGLGVAVIGPDGAGKTTLVTALHDRLPVETRTMYMGLAGMGRIPQADALRVPGLVLAARLSLLGARYAVCLYHRSRGRIVLFDRYTLDGAVPSGTRLGPLGRLSRRVQAAAFPTPDLVLFLDASGATMHHRSGEYSEQMLEEWRAAYRRLRSSVRSLEVLDAERPADVVRRDAQQRVWRRYADRAAGAA